MVIRGKRGCPTRVNASKADAGPRLLVNPAGILTARSPSKPNSCGWRTPRGGGEPSFQLVEFLGNGGRFCEPTEAVACANGFRGGVGELGVCAVLHGEPPEQRIAAGLALRPCGRPIAREGVASAVG